MNWEFIGEAQNEKRKVQNCGTALQLYLPPSNEVRVSGGHLCEAEAPTEPTGEN